MFKFFKKVREIENALDKHNEYLKKLEDRIAVLEFKERNGEKVFEVMQVRALTTFGFDSAIRVAWCSEKHNKVSTFTIPVPDALNVKWTQVGEYLEVRKINLCFIGSMAPDHVYRLNRETDELEPVPLSLYLAAKKSGFDGGKNA